jgi:hypothetical protein
MDWPKFVPKQEKSSKKLKSKKDIETMAKKTLYREQYCKKHKQYYASYLHECPTCGGEKIAKKMKPETEGINKELTKLK